MTHLDFIIDSSLEAKWNLLGISHGFLNIIFFCWGLPGIKSTSYDLMTTGAATRAINNHDDISSRVSTSTKLICIRLYEKHTLVQVMGYY